MKYCQVEVLWQHVETIDEFIIKVNNIAESYKAYDIRISIRESAGRFGHVATILYLQETEA